MTVTKSYGKWTIEIVDLPIDSMVIFNSKLLVLPEGRLYRVIHMTHTTYLLGGAITSLKNDGVRQWGWDDIPYVTWKS